VYEEILAHELVLHGLACRRQVDIPLTYKDVRLDAGFRVDILVENKVIIELKSVEAVMPIHKKQLLTYLKLSGIKLGLLINFDEVLLKNGITRVVNKL
jgi:GxxExxY protein